MLADDLLELLGERVPADHTRQVVAEWYVGEWYRRLRHRSGPARVLDLGCGAGDSVDVFRRFDPDVRWVGLDLQTSPEVASRTRSDAEFATFEGARIPFGDGEFELVFCKQVLEHVRRPEPLMREVMRVLELGGHLAGSTSQLEPYHSLSVGNFTPYGLALLLQDAGLEPVEFRPNIDGLTLVVQRGMGMHRFFYRWWARESPLNRFIGLFGRVARLDRRSVNAIKLLLCGQFCFLARRPQASGSRPDQEIVP
ncbi:MAG: class I SAM-dependent methyltransferase [Solirubrobacteraceae bacterium]